MPTFAVSTRQFSVAASEMPASIGVNLRVTGHCRQGGRKYMEDFFSVAYQQTEDERDLEYAFFGIYDGHGGAEAAAFAKERLMETIVRHKKFWSEKDEDVLCAIKLGYIATHYAMWREQDKWPKTTSGLPSTAGTTASIAFIRRGKIYIGHVGDSGIVLGYQEPGCLEWKAKPLTKDHKPECAVEMSRIEQCGGKVVSKSGVPRVVWSRPRIGHKGPVRRSTPIDEIPFLAVARSLGDLWSYNSDMDQFVVSPEPDCSVIPIDTNSFRCLIFGTDGLYNMLNAQMAVHIVQQAERHNEEAALSDAHNKVWLNPSKCLVERALEMWSNTKMRADNTSVVTLMLDPPGPPRAQVLRDRKKQYPDSGLQIVTRYQNESAEPKKSQFPGTPEYLPQTTKTWCKDATKDPLDETMKSALTSLMTPPDKNSCPNVSMSQNREADCSDVSACSNNEEENIQINEISSSSNIDPEEDSENRRHDPADARKSTRSSKKLREITGHFENSKNVSRASKRRTDDERPGESKCKKIEVTPRHNLRQRKKATPEPPRSKTFDKNDIIINLQLSKVESTRSVRSSVVLRSDDVSVRRSLRFGTKSGVVVKVKIKHEVKKPKMRQKLVRHSKVVKLAKSSKKSPKKRESPRRKVIDARNSKKECVREAKGHKKRF